MTALAADPSGKYIVAAVAEKLYVWQTCTGVLHRVLSGSGHYLAVTHVAFADDGAHFVTASKDGNVLAWNLLEVVANERIPGQAADRAGAPMPKYALGGHKVGDTCLTNCFFRT